MSALAFPENNFEKVERLYLESLEIKIESQDQYAGMAEYLANIKQVFKTLDTERKEKVKPIDEARKKIQDAYNPYLDKLTKTEALIKKAMVGRYGY